MRKGEAEAEAIIEMFRTMHLDGLDRISLRYAHNAIFEDPAVRAEGRVAITEVYRNLLSGPDFDFRIIDSAHTGEKVFIHWILHGDVAGTRPFELDGVTRIHFNEDGEITEHSDYWANVPDNLKNELR